MHQMDFLISNAVIAATAVVVKMKPRLDLVGLSNLPKISPRYFAHKLKRLNKKILFPNKFSAVGMNDKIDASALYD